MARFFMKKVKVPGLLSEEGLIAGAREMIAAREGTTSLAPPNTSALGMTDKVLEEVGKNTKIAAPSTAKISTGAPAASAGVDTARLRATQQGLFGNVGALTDPGERAAEREQQVADAARLAKSNKDFNDALVSEVYGKTEDEIAEKHGGHFARQFKPGMTEDEIRAIIDANDAETLDQDAERSAFVEKQGLPTETWWRSAIEGAVKTAAQTGTTALRAPGAWYESGVFVATGADVGKSWPRQWADSLDKELNKALPGDPTRQKEYADMLAKGAGSMSAFLLAGYVGRVLGIGEGVVSGGLGAAVGGASQYEDAENFDANGWAKFGALVMGSVNGMTEAIPIERAFMRAEVATGGLVSRVLKNSSASSLTEFTQEVQQAAGEDIIAKYLAGYDKDRALDVADWLVQGSIGAITGGAMGGVVAALPGGRIDQVKEDRAKVETTVNNIIAQGDAHLEEIFKTAGDAEIVGTEAVDGQDGVAAADAGAVESAPVSAPPARARVEPVTIDPPRGDAVQQIIEQQAAYHGTPHKFDKFSMEKIGTGEGAQAYGHGLYFAGNRSVAEGYQKTLTQRAAQDPEYWQGVVLPKGLSTGEQDEFNALGSDMRKNGNLPAEGMTRWRELKAKKDEREVALDAARPKGALYQVDIPDDAELLDWDAPLSAQPESVKTALQTFAERLSEGRPDVRAVWEKRLRGDKVFAMGDMNGDQLYKMLSKEFGNDAAASKALLDAGVTGLRYLDAGSRTAGDGTRNYVIFDDSRITITDIESQQADLVTPDTMVAAADPTPNLDPLPGAVGKPSAPAVQAVMAYAAASRLPITRQTTISPVAPAVSGELSSLYDEMLDQPDDPAVMSSYQALMEEVTAQYAFAAAANGGDLPAYPQTPSYPAGHPLAPFADQFWPLYQFFGTGLEGATDPENMWQAYARVFSASARPAFTTETRGVAGWEAAHGEPLPQRKIGLMRSTAWQYDLEQVLADRSDIDRMTGTATVRQPFIGEPTRPTQGIPTLGNQDDAPDIMLSKFSKTLERLLSLTVRTGRLAGNRSVMGEYHRYAALIRMRDRNDFSTLVHEAGHALNDAQSAAIDGFVAANAAAVERFGLTHYAGDLTKAPSETRQREGFAEFFRAFVTHRAYAERQAPELVDAFTRLLQRNDPQMLDGLNTLGTQFEAWLHLPSARLNENMIVDGMRPTGIAEALKEISDAGFSTWMKEHVRRQITWAVQQQSGLREITARLLNQYAQALGKPLDLAYADNPIALSTLARNAQALASNEMQDGVIPYRGTDPATRSLQDALMIIHGQRPRDMLLSMDKKVMKSFDAYLMERRALSEWERYDRGEIMREPVGRSKGDIVQGAKDHEAEHPEFVEAASIVHEYGMGLWTKMYDAGLMTRETYEDIAGRSFYAPLQRDMSDLKQGGGANGIQFGRSAVIKRFGGSSRDVISPMAILMQKTAAVEKLIAQNDAKLALARLAERAPGAGSIAVKVKATQMIGRTYSVEEVARQLVDKAIIPETASPEERQVNAEQKLDVADAADLMLLLEASIERGDSISLYRSQQATAQGENLLFYWDKGKIAAIQLVDGELGRDVVNYMEAMGGESMDWPLEIVAASSTLFRSAVTKWPDFLLVNFVRGELQNALLTRGYVPFLSGARGVIDEVTQSRWAKSANRGRMMMGGINTAALHQATIDRDVRALRARGFLPKLIGDIKNPWDLSGAISSLSRLTETTESGGRLGVYRATYNRAKRDGLSDYEATTEAAYIATDLMNFGQHGSRMMTVRRLVPFLNAQLIGLHKTFRTLGGDDAARRKGLVFALTAWAKDINQLPLSRTEKDQLRTGRALALKMLMLAGLSAILHYLNQDDPDYVAANEYTRATSWVIPLHRIGLGKPGDIWIVHKPFELAMFANIVERGLEEAGGDTTARDKMLRGIALNVIPPMIPPGIQSFAEVLGNYDFFTQQPIVKPGDASPGAREFEYNERTSDFARWVGATTGLSPMMVDHVGSSFGASAYRDISHMTDAYSTTRPTPDVNDWFITRRFVKDARQGSQLTADLWGQASTSNGKLGGAYQRIHNMVKKGLSEVAINDALAKMTDEERAYAVLGEYMTAEDKRLHPVNRATALTSVIGEMSKQVSSDLGLADTTYDGPDDEPVQFTMTPARKREVIDVLAELAQREVWNTMIAMGHPTYKGRKELDVQGTLDLLRETSPDAYEEYVRRVEKKKVYDFQIVKDAWPEARQRLIGEGQDAILSDLTAGAEVVF